MLRVRMGMVIALISITGKILLKKKKKVCLCFRMRKFAKLKSYLKLTTMNLSQGWSQQYKSQVSSVGWSVSLLLKTSQMSWDNYLFPSKTGSGRRWSELHQCICCYLFFQILQGMLMRNMSTHVYWTTFQWDTFILMWAIDSWIIVTFTATYWRAHYPTKVNKD